MNGLFQALAALSVLGAAAVFCQIRLRRLKRAQIELEEFSRSLLRTQEAERRRIAAEIHDGLGQNLLIINSRAALGLAAAHDPPAMARQLTEISKVCLRAIEEARQIAHNLGPPHLDAIGLTEALEGMIDRVAASTSLRFERKIEPVDGLFSTESSMSIYRITQEALNNVMKHSR